MESPVPASVLGPVLDKKMQVDNDTGLRLSILDAWDSLVARGMSVVFPTLGAKRTICLLSDFLTKSLHEAYPKL